MSFPFTNCHVLGRPTMFSHSGFNKFLETTRLASYHLSLVCTVAAHWSVFKYFLNVIIMIWSDFLKRNIIKESCAMVWVGLFFFIDTSFGTIKSWLWTNCYVNFCPSFKPNVLHSQMYPVSKIQSLINYLIIQEINCLLLLFTLSNEQSLVINCLGLTL